MTDHRAEAERLLELAKAGADFMDQAGGYVRRAAVHATLADRCPDPDAHQAEDVPADVLADVRRDLDGLRRRLAVALGLHPDDGPDDDGLVDAADRAARMADTPDAHQAEGTGKPEVAPGVGIYPNTAAGATGVVWPRLVPPVRPPIRPEVVAVVEAAEAWYMSKPGPIGDLLCSAVEALPEDWRDGAAAVCEHCRIDQHGWHLNEGRCAVGGCDCPAPAAVPAVLDEAPADVLDEAVTGSVSMTDWHGTRTIAVGPAVLDEAGIERAARVAAKQRGVDGKTYDSLPDFTKAAGIERARVVVRAYLGDTERDN